MFGVRAIGLVGCLLAAQASACELALALAVDVSGSVNPQEYRIQRDGLAHALRDPIISEALVRSNAQLMLIQWTGSSRQQITIPWTRIDSFAAVDAFADAVSKDPRVWRNFSTAVGEALETAMATFDQVDYCARHLIDISGDGVSNEGVDPKRLHSRLRQRGIVVNAIAIEGSEPDLTGYFFENVIVGEGAFVVTASGFADYPEKIRKKLLREVTKQTASLD